MTTKKTTATKSPMTDALLENIQAQLSTVAEQVQAIAVGRGTRPDVAAQAAAAQPVPAPAPEPPTLAQRAEALLRARTADARALAAELGAPAARVSELLQALRKAGKIHNVGTETGPLWTWRVGDEAPTSELTDLVRRLLSERPMTTQELADATGAKFTRVGGAIVAVQRSGARIVDLGAGRGRAARWFVVPEHARDARLAPKKRG